LSNNQTKVAKKREKFFPKLLLFEKNSKQKREKSKEKGYQKCIF
jgi:hypothetical protein